MIAPMPIAEQELLLGRSVERLLTPIDRQQFAGRTCLITGAGGSVGSELAIQVAACRPARLMLLDQSEEGLFRIEQFLAETAPGVSLEPLLTDVTRGSAVANVLRRVRPDVVFHAAAYKHVSMAEQHIAAAARVNVLGTCAVLAAAKEVGARFVLVSTDKAAAPRSVMGATKRLAELATLASADRRLRPIVVRFGNVLASSGSFVEVMRERIRRGQPLIITDPNATRFFMTVTEAASLVMKASALGRGGETFWLDMGPQVRIGDLAERMLHAAALQGLSAVPIKIVGLRPGEKLVEELASQGTSLEKTSHTRIWVATQPSQSTAECQRWISAIRRAVARDDAAAVLDVLTDAVADFVPSAQAWEIAGAHTARARRRSFARVA